MAIVNDLNTEREAPLLSTNSVNAGCTLVLNTEESEALLRTLAEPPAPLSPEMKAAIANYRRIKARILR
jgi:hypothetical protein